MERLVCRDGPINDTQNGYDVWENQYYIPMGLVTITITLKSSIISYMKTIVTYYC